MTRRALPLVGQLARAWGNLSRAVVGRFDNAACPSQCDAERGAASVEFVLLLPAFLMVFISSFEASIMLTRQVMLERAVDIVVRDIRLDTGSTVTQGQVRAKVCNRAKILPDCSENLVIEMTEIDQITYSTPDTDAPCVNQLTSIVPPSRFAANRTGRMILLRACYSVLPTLPLSVMAGNRTLGSHLVNDEDGSFRMVTSNAFVVESN
ncbi:TadE family protein [Jannaschia helgolandensis]|uniref:TadE/TadG family type IV pilus assembly protein n=1 Tax=Jannaschia helgolandensis TaxID=188906 RepID=UPI0030D75889|tara:strand:+ start:1878 stop:2501 length:624 start_codon:yes stop_codon:yes gene_type:complete